MGPGLALILAKPQNGATQPAIRLGQRQQAPGLPLKPAALPSAQRTAPGDRPSAPPRRGAGSTPAGQGIFGNEGQVGHVGTPVTDRRGAGQFNRIRLPKATCLSRASRQFGVRASIKTSRITSRGYWLWRGRQMSDVILVIGDKSISSWSMRPWLALRHAGIAFQEVSVKLRQEEKTRAAILPIPHPVWCRW